ncbi:MAG: hypothetical protein ACRDS0_01985 [Pseudonocardiaceae bacterium]
MRIYAELRGRAARQVLADLLVVVWVVLVVGIARAAWVLVTRLEGSAQRFSGAGETISGTFMDAARSAAKVPIVGHDLAGAFGPGARDAVRHARERAQQVGAKSSARRTGHPPSRAGSVGYRGDPLPPGIGRYGLGKRPMVGRNRPTWWA